MGKLSVDLVVSKQGRILVTLVDSDELQHNVDQHTEKQSQSSEAAESASNGLNQPEQQDKVNSLADNEPSAVLEVSEIDATLQLATEEARRSCPEDSHKDDSHRQKTAMEKEEHTALAEVSPPKDILPGVLLECIGLAQIDEGAWELQQTLSVVADVWYLYGVVHEHTDGSTTLLLDLPSKRLFKRQASGPVMVVGNLVCTGQDTYAVEKSTFPVLFFSSLSSGLLESPMQSLEDLVMPHTSSDGSCSSANLAELCMAIKPDASDMDKECFKVLMNPEDPTFSDGVHPSFRAVALRVREASELEEGLCAQQGPRDLKMPEGLAELSQHLKSSWKLKSLVSEVEQHLSEGFAGLCKFLQSLSPGLRFTMQQLRGVLLYTRLWCAAGTHTSKDQYPKHVQLNAKNVLRAWNVVPLRVIGDGEQGGHNRVSDAGSGDQHLAHFQVASVKIPTHKRTRVIRASDTTLFSPSKTTCQANTNTRRTKRPAAGHSGMHLDETAFQTSLKRTQYESLEQHLIGHAARERQDEYAVPRPKRSHLSWYTGQQVRGKVTAVEYKPGLKIEPVWESLPFETQQLVNSPAAKSPITPDLPTARTALNRNDANDAPGGYGQEVTATDIGHRQVEAPALLQTSRRFANMRVGEHVCTPSSPRTHAGATGPITTNSLRSTHARQKLQSSTPPSSSQAANFYDQTSLASASAATNTAQVPIQSPQVPHVPASPNATPPPPFTSSNSPVNSDGASPASLATSYTAATLPTEAHARSPAPVPSQDVNEAPRQHTIQDSDGNQDLSSKDVLFPSAAYGLSSAPSDVRVAHRKESNIGQFEVHDASSFYGNRTAAGKIGPKPKPTQDPQVTRPVAPFIAGGQTISRQPVGNIYDGRYNRSRLLKPSPATIKNHVLHMDEQGNAAWFPVTHDQTYSRFPAYVEAMTAVEVCTEALLEAQGSNSVQNSNVGISVKGDMYSAQPGGWKSASTAAYLYDQMN